MKKLFAIAVLMFSMSFVFGASPPEYDIGTKDEVKVFVKSVNNVTTFEVATVNLQTLDVQYFRTGIATVTAFKTDGTGIVGIKTIYNRCHYLFYPKPNLYTANIDDYPIPITNYISKPIFKNFRQFTSGGMPYRS